ncbi:elongation factor P 5-aminopentanone reductase [Scatolibacter rhodanostii]|uniref:elongation factor P 5-aminopentanone reductase n=1 Tax=Scatolibacter rhodanostii TaxID=2014781 RepID=UPI000C088934|nr:SDR family oxidoreductase [Scatolibacter rhodanostii]
MKKKTVLVTGASGGIGSAIAHEFAKKGYQVVIAYLHNQKAAEDTLKKVQELGGEGICVQADIRNEKDVSALFDAAEAKFGFVDILINNAGISQMGLFTDVSYDEWQNLLQTNLTSVFLCCKRALIPMIRRKEGAIVNISSIWGEVGASCEVAYSATKAAIIGLTKALAKEEGPSGIRVNAIAPGLIETKMNSHLSQEDISLFCEETPLCKMGQPSDVAETAVFLAENQFITGQIVGVNGGLA